MAAESHSTCVSTTDSKLSHAVASLEPALLSATLLSREAAHLSLSRHACGVHIGAMPCSTLLMQLV